VKELTGIVTVMTTGNDKQNAAPEGRKASQDMPARFVTIHRFNNDSK
jgi:hypothetical protein